MNRNFFCFPAAICLLSLTLFGCSRPVSKVDIVHDISFESDAAQGSPDVKNFIEWWYFDGVVNDRLSFVLTFWVSTKGNFVEMALYDKFADRRNVYRENIAKVDTRVSSGACRVKMGDSEVFEKDGKYSVVFKNKDIIFKYSLEPALGGFGMKAEDTQKKSTSWPWVVMVPRGSIRGTLKQGDRTVDIRGTGYHDHIFIPATDLSLSPKAGGWFWARFFTKNYTIIMSQIFKADTASLFIFENGRLIRSDILSPPIFQKEEIRKINRDELPKTVHFRSPPFSITIKNQHLSRKTQRYTRFIGSIRFRSAGEKTETVEYGEGLIEYVYSFSSNDG